MHNLSIWCYAFSPLMIHQTNGELSDDMSLKKHLLHLKANSRQKKVVKRSTESLEGQSEEKLMEHLFCLETKLWKLKQVLSTVEKVINNESDDLSLDKQKVVYVPVAEIKEKTLCWSLSLLCESESESETQILILPQLCKRTWHLNRIIKAGNDSCCRTCVISFVYVIHWAYKAL